MWWNSMLLAQVSNDAVTVLLGIAAGESILLVLFGLFLLPILIWRSRRRRRGYAGLGAICGSCRKPRRRGSTRSILRSDVFVRAYQRLDTFDVRRPVKRWLVKFAYRSAQENWRSHVRRTVREGAVAAERQQNCGDGNPTDRMLADERSELVWQAVYALSMTQRTADVLYYREKLPVEEVVGVMGVSAGTVKTHLSRARAQIQANLRARGLDEGDIP